MPQTSSADTGSTFPRNLFAGNAPILTVSEKLTSGAGHSFPHQRTNPPGAGIPNAGFSFMKLTQEQFKTLLGAYNLKESVEDSFQALIDAYEKMRPSDSDEWIAVKERLPTEADAHALSVIWCGYEGHPKKIGIGHWGCPEGATHWKRIIPPVITPPTLEEVERPKFEEWMKANHGPGSIDRHEAGYLWGSSDTSWEAWLQRAKYEQSAKA